jgi:hypothetical protein
LNEYDDKQKETDETYINHDVEWSRRVNLKNNNTNTKIIKTYVQRNKIEKEGCMFFTR